MTLSEQPDLSLPHLLTYGNGDEMGNSTVTITGAVRTKCVSTGEAPRQGWHTVNIQILAIDPIIIYLKPKASNKVLTISLGTIRILLLVKIE